MNTPSTFWTLRPETGRRLKRLLGRRSRHLPGRRRVVLPGAALLLIGLTLPGCASLVQAPAVSLSDVQLRAVGLQGATVRVLLEVYNPNRFGLSSEALDYTLSYAAAGPASGSPELTDWQPLARGRAAEDVRLPAHDTVAVSIDVPFRYRDVGPALVGLLRDGTLSYRFEGAFGVGSPVGTVRVPFDRTGRFGS